MKEIQLYTYAEAINLSKDYHALPLSQTSAVTLTSFN